MRRKYNKSLKQIVNYLKNIDNPLGDLCSDILRDDSFPIQDVEKAWEYLDHLVKYGRRDYLYEPINDLKTIYDIINK